MEERGSQSQETEKKSFFQRLWQGTKKLAKQFWEMTKRAFRDHSKTTWIWIGIFIAVLVCTAALLIIQIYDNEWLFRIVVLYFVKPIYEINIWGVLLFMVIMAIQAVLLPIPSEAVLLSAGMIWGFWWGTLFGIIGSMIAGFITYQLVLKGGRPLAEKFVGPEAVEILDRFIGKHGAWAIIILRAFPFMAFDPVSFAAGLTKVKNWVYYMATFIGSIIRCIFYAWLGTIFFDQPISYYLDPAHVHEMELAIENRATLFNWLSFGVILVAVIFFALYQFVLMPYLKKKGKMDGNNKTEIITEQDHETHDIEHKPDTSTTS